MIVRITDASRHHAQERADPGENHQVGERVQALISKSAKLQRRQIILRRLTRLIRRSRARVPEVGGEPSSSKHWPASQAIEPRSVSSIDSKVDAVGACVGVRGSRIKNIVDELGGEKIDIVRWNESSQILISNALKPAEVAEVSLCFELGRATVVVNDDQLSLAIGKRGQKCAARGHCWASTSSRPRIPSGVQRLDQTSRALKESSRNT